MPLCAAPARKLHIRAAVLLCWPCRQEQAAEGEGGAEGSAGRGEEQAEREMVPGEEAGGGY